MSNKGQLILIPVPLNPEGLLSDSLCAHDRELLQSLDHFIVENAKTARAFLKSLPLTKALQGLNITQLDKHKPDSNLDQMLAPLLQGHAVGLMSEAGCPAVADAGAEVVAWAQKKSCVVTPLVGPSALMLALMAAGLNGQSFAFNGYLPSNADERRLALKQLEDRSARWHQTQMAIETPYRARAWFTDALHALAPHTRLSVAVDLTLPGQRCITRSVQQWRDSPDASGALTDHRLVVFSWLADTGTSPARSVKPRT